MTFNFSLIAKFQLRDIVNKLCEKRAISSKESFLKGYDNGNSIWDGKEIDLIKKDYNNGKLDNLYNYVEEKPLLDGDIRFKYFKEKVTKLSPQEQNQAKYLLNINKCTQRLSREDILKLAELPAEQFEKLKKFLYIERRDNNQFNTTDLCDLAQISDEKINLAINLSYIRSRKDEQFDGDEIVRLTELTETQFKIAKNYFYIKARAKDNIQLSGEEICNIAKLSPENLKEFERITYKDKNYSIDSSQEGSVDIIYDDYNGHRNLVSVPQKFKQTTSYTMLSNNNARLLNDLTIKYDSLGNEIKTCIQISDIDSEELNITQETNGTIKDLQKTYIDSITSETVVVKEYVSPNGTKTFTELRKNGNNKHLVYIITSADGDVLLHREYSFDKVSDTKTITKIDGKIYEAEYTGESVIVTDKNTGKVYTVDYKKILGDDLSTPFARQCIKIIENMPARDIIYMTRNKLTIKNSYAHCDFDFSINIYDAEETRNTFNNVLAIFMHEFGHFKDLSEQADFEVISGNQELIETFQRELQAFQEDSSSSQRQVVIHFTEDGITEMVAETNMMTNGYSTEETSLRDFYLQQYFPETIAIITRLLDEDFETKYC